MVCSICKGTGEQVKCGIKLECEHCNGTGEFCDHCGESVDVCDGLCQGAVEEDE